MNRPSELFKKELKIVNIGLQIFYDALKDQGAAVVHVDWKPPAGGNEKLLAILQKLK